MGGVLCREGEDIWVTVLAGRVRIFGVQVAGNHDIGRFMAYLGLGDLDLNKEDKKLLMVAEGIDLETIEAWEHFSRHRIHSLFLRKTFTNKRLEETKLENEPEDGDGKTMFIACHPSTICAEFASTDNDLTLLDFGFRETMLKL